MGLSAQEREQAASIVSGWVWQMAEGHNYRFRYANRTLTRFCEAASMQPDEVRLVIEYLRDQVIGSDGISILNKCIDLGSGWRAKDAWYQTVPSDKWANTDSTKVRVYQVLYQAASDAAAGDGPYSVENGCQYKVSHTFYWDVESMPTVPSATSGVEFRMQGTVRDKETGLFSCVIERRERIQQDISEYVSSETAFQTVKEEAHIGVKKTQISTTGRQASASNGKVVKRKVTKNPDCTSDITNEELSEKEVDRALVEFRNNAFESVETTLDKSKGASIPSSSVAIGEEVTSEMTDGRRWNNRRTKRKEKTVKNAVVTYKRSLRAQTVTRTNRSESDGAYYQKPDIGGMLRTEKTEGGKVTTTEEELTPIPAGKLNEEIRDDAFEKSVETLNNVLVPPEDAVPEAADGVHSSRSVHKTEERSFDVAEKKVTEKEVEDSKVVIERTLRAIRTTKTSRSQPDPLSADDMDVGETRVSELTPGKRYNTQSSRFELKNSGALSSVKEETIFERIEETMTNVDVASFGSAAPRDGVLKRVGTRRSEEVGFDVTIRTTEPIPRSWQTPEVSTNYMYSRAWHFRNFKRSQMEKLIKQASAWFDGKINAWVNAKRPPSSHSIDPQVTLLDNGRYNGSVTVGARWSTDTAGQNGETDCLFYAIVYEYRSFDPIGSRNFQKDHLANLGSFWDKTWRAGHYKVLRAAGRGASVLNRISSQVGLTSRPQLSYNPQTGHWELEAVIWAYPEERYTYTGWEASAWMSVVNNIPTNQAPTGSASEPAIHDTEFGG